MLPGPLLAPILFLDRYMGRLHDRTDLLWVGALERFHQLGRRSRHFVVLVALNNNVANRRLNLAGNLQPPPCNRHNAAPKSS